MACNLTGITMYIGGGISPYNVSLCDQGCETGCNNVASTNYDCVYFTACCGTYGLKIVDVSGCTSCSDLIVDTCFTTTTTTTDPPGTTTTTTTDAPTTTTTTTEPSGPSTLFRPCDGQSGCTSGNIIVPTIIGGGGEITMSMNIPSYTRVKGATISTDPIYSGYTDSDGVEYTSYYDYIVNKYAGTFTSTGVTSMYVGRKITNNIDTGVYCITINVIKKKSLSELTESELLPKELDGVPTDISTSGEIVLHSSCLYDKALILSVSTACNPNYGPGSLGYCSGNITSISVPACSDHGNPYYSPASNQRAIPGGVSFGTTSALAAFGGVGSGTLGWLAYDNSDDRIVGITNNHVIGYNFAAGGLNADPINYPGLDCGSALAAAPNGGQQPPNWTTGYVTQQPSYPDHGNSSAGVQMGAVKRIHPLCHDYTQNKVDGAVIDLTEEPTTTILGLAWGPFQHATTAEINASVGSYVYKVGRSTGNMLSVSYPDVVITAVHAANIALDSSGLFMYNNQIMFQSVGDGDPAPSIGGDSGSAILCCIGGALKIVGLNFAGNFPKYMCCGASSGDINSIWPNGFTGIANRIDEVESKLNISSWDGSIVVSSTASNYIKVNDKCYYNAGITTRPIQHTIDASYSDCTACNSSI
mgnify:CR=1 FL=1